MDLDINVVDDVTVEDFLMENVNDDPSDLRAIAKAIERKHHIKYIAEIKDRDMLYKVINPETSSLLDMSRVGFIVEAIIDYLGL